MDFDQQFLESRANINDNEKKVLAYISQNKEQVITLNISQLAAVVHFSPSFLSKLFKKIGFETFAECKVSLKNAVNGKKSLGKNKSLIELQQYDLHQTKQIIDQTDFSKLFSILGEASSIYCYGTGHIHQNIMRELSRHLMYLTNKKIIRLSGKSEFEGIQYSIQPEDILIISSHTGETPEMIKMVMYLLQIGVKIVNISSLTDNELSSISTFNLFYYSNPIETSFPNRHIQSFLPLNYCIDTFIRKYIEYLSE